MKNIVETCVEILYGVIVIVKLESDLLLKADDQSLNGWIW